MNFHRKPHTFIGQVDLKVSNLERSLAFYQYVIGFRVLEQSDGKAILTADGKTLLLSIEQPGQVSPKQPRTTGLYHFALLLPKRSDLARVLQHFIQHQIPLQGASDHLVSEALYLADPDGNGIEIYADLSRHRHGRGPTGRSSWIPGPLIFAIFCRKGREPNGTAFLRRR